MENQNSDEVKSKRASIIKEISKRKHEEFINKNIGKTLEVLIEKHPDKHTQNLKGITRNYLTVQIISDRTDLFNTIKNVKISKFENGKIYGELV